jgi:hypothetical protein
MRPPGVIASVNAELIRRQKAVLSDGAILDCVEKAYTFNTDNPMRAGACGALELRLVVRVATIFCERS